MAKTRSDIELKLFIIEKANYDYGKIKKIINAEIEKCESRIREIEAMGEEAFLSMVAKQLFGVASKGYYTSNLKKRIEELKHVKDGIDYLLEQYSKNKGWFNYVLSNYYKGYVKPMREAIEKLAKSRFNTKLLTFSFGV